MIAKDKMMSTNPGVARPLVWLAMIAIGVAVGIFAAGCSTLLDKIGEEDIAKLDKLAEVWIEKLEAKIGEQVSPPATAPSEPIEPGAPATDQLDYALLRWQYGGVNASGAKLDSPRLSGLSCNGRSVSYHWDVGMSGWGLSNDEAGALCCIFFERDGKWEGGKFDWVSVSRTNRELKHVESYSNWPSSGIKLPWRGKVAFVVVSADRRRRSNVLVAEAK